MVGFFDSGVGGLSVLVEVQRLLPSEEFVYFGDTAHVPYGPRPAREIAELSLAAVEWLRRRKPALVVLACNTATAVAIDTLRARHPDIPIVGVVPVVKTLAEQTRTRRVAVVATTATLQSATYRHLKKKFVQGVEILELARPEWVTSVEAGELTAPLLIASVSTTTKEILDWGGDCLALGSTHFPWLRPMITSALPGVRVFDSGPAVARQVVRVLTANGQLPHRSHRGQTTFVVSGDPRLFSLVASKLLGQTVTAEKVP